MKVLFISKSGACGGGASLMAEQTALWLEERGHEVQHLRGTMDGTVYSFQSSFRPESGFGRIGYDLLERNLKKVGLPNVFPWEFFYKIRKEIREVDVVHFHDLYSQISIFTPWLCRMRKPVVFTVHDCSTFTGGCTFPMGCLNYQQFCNTCPQLETISYGGMQVDSTRWLQRLKRMVTRYSKIEYIFPSQWVRKEMESTCSEIAGERHTILHGMDLSVYQQKDKNEMRRKWDIPEGRKVVIMAANSFGGRRKGFRFCLKALKSVEDLRPFVLLVGKYNSLMESLLEGFDFRFTGYLSEREEMAEVYSLSDLFFFCSLDDNLPLTVIESMACGTPMVGFATGGIPEITLHNETGYLTPKGDQKAINAGLRYALTDAPLEEWSGAGIKRANAHFSHETYLQNHLELYESAMSRFKKERR